MDLFIAKTVSVVHESTKNISKILSHGTIRVDSSEILHYTKSSFVCTSVIFIKYCLAPALLPKM
jgi:hypothetical protein